MTEQDGAIELHTLDKASQVARLIEIEPLNEDQFLILKETLTRIGIGVVDKKTLYQSCHVLQKRGKYYLVHFKELFGLDGRQSFMALEDIERRNKIAVMLEAWKLLKLVTVVALDPKSTVKIQFISFAEKKSWNLQPKYQIGTKPYHGTTNGNKAAPTNNRPVSPSK